MAVGLVAVLLVSRFVFQQMGAAVASVPGLAFLVPNEGQRRQIERAAQELADRITHVIGTDPSSLSKSIDSLVGAEPLNIALVLVGIVLAIYVVMRPLMPAFRLKRMLFNLDEADPSARAATIVRWHVPTCTGLYRREREVLTNLGSKPPRELPLDLIVPGLLVLAVPFSLGAYLVARGLGPPNIYYSFIPIFPFEFRLGGLLMLPAVARVAWLVRAWHGRQAEGPPCAGRQVDLGDNVHASLRDPLVVALLTFIVPYYLPIWWYLLNRELSRYGWQRKVPGLGRAPLVSLFAMLPTLRFTLLPALISVARTHVRIQRAEVSAGRMPARLRASPRIIVTWLVGGSLIVVAPIASPAVLVAPELSRYVGYGFGAAVDPTYAAPTGVLILLLVAALCFSPVVVAYLQHRANAVWREVGRVVVEGPMEKTPAREPVSVPDHASATGS